MVVLVTNHEIMQGKLSKCYTLHIQVVWNVKSAYSHLKLNPYLQPNVTYILIRNSYEHVVQCGPRNIAVWEHDKFGAVLEAVPLKININPDLRLRAAGSINSSM